MGIRYSCSGDVAVLHLGQVWRFPMWLVSNFVAEFACERIYKHCCTVASIVHIIFLYLLLFVSQNSGPWKNVLDAGKPEPCKTIGDSLN